MFMGKPLLLPDVPCASMSWSTGYSERADVSIGPGLSHRLIGRAVRFADDTHNLFDTVIPGRPAGSSPESTHKLDGSPAMGSGFSLSRAPE